VDVGVLRVANDRTHLEGVWNVSGRGEIETKELTMSAPKHAVIQTTETHGWSVSLSPAALLGAALAFATPGGIGAMEALSCLPNVAVHESGGSSSSTAHVPAILKADDLFIRCDNAVFSGAKIHSRLMEAIVTGDLTVESLADEFRSESHSTDIGISLAAIGGLVQDVKIDRLYVPQTSSVPGSDGFIHPAFSAVPTMRFADEDAMSLKVLEVAQMVGQERFYLTVGGLLHKKGATVGLKPDGVVVRNDAERISAGRTLEERVHEAESHHRTVINPAIGEFVAMMNQVDELKQVMAKIEFEQIKANIPKPQREKNNRELKEFLQKPEVKEKFQKLKLARQKQQRAAEELRRLEAEDPTLPMRMASMSLAEETPAMSSAKSAPKATPKTATPSIKPTIQKASDVSSGMEKTSSTTSVSEPLIVHDELPAPSVSSTSDEMNRVFAWSRARKENKSCGREAMEMLSSINESLDKFATDHPNIAKVGTAIVEGIGYAAVGGTLLVAAEGGILPLALTGSTMLASNEVVAAVLEHGSEPLVKGAASLGNTEAEAVRFGTNMAGTINKLIFLGATKLAVKAVKGGKGTSKSLSASEAAAVSKQSFREMQTNPAKFEASISKGISEAMGKNPMLKLEVERLAAPKMHKHHIFPREFEADFGRVGIQIDEHCMFVPSTNHIVGIHGKGIPTFMPGKWNRFC
jgi:hypothetical protein